MPYRFLTTKKITMQNRKFTFEQLLITESGRQRWFGCNKRKFYYYFKVLNNNIVESENFKTIKELENHYEQALIADLMDI